MLAIRYSGVSEGAMSVSLNGCRIFRHAASAPSAGTVVCGYLAVPGAQQLVVEARAPTMRVSELLVLQAGQPIWRLEAAGELEATEPRRFEFELAGLPSLALDELAPIDEAGFAEATTALFEFAEALQARDLQRCARLVSPRLDRLDRLHGQPEGSARRVFDETVGRLFARGDVRFLTSPRDQIVAEPALAGLAVEFRDASFRAPIRIRYGGPDRPEFDIDARIGKVAGRMGVVA